jgi:aryl-alcohol dehydrogenase-like predicted oxidoreductase
MSFLDSEKKAPSPLAYHRVLSPSASIKVSPICLGTMNFGDTEPFKSLLGECNRETSFAILDHFFKMGGNFLDCANMYHAGQSEQWLGEWMAIRNVRDQTVVATKFTNALRTMAQEKDHTILTNYAGSNRKSLKLSLEQSLKSLRTTYIDILYVHCWDPSCEIEELMRSLDDVVRKGQVLYLGVSNWPAWMVVKANDYARSHGLTPFVVYEGRWNAADREIERDILPVLKMEGMGLTVWSPLGGGKFKPKTTDHDGRAVEGLMGEAPRADFEKIGEVMAEIGKAKGFDEIAVAMRYVMLKVC